MSLASLSVEEATGLIVHVSRGMIASRELLSHADQAIGDGDHGIGMARGFEAVEAKLRGQVVHGQDELFRLVGMTLLASIGGAAGAVFGSFFLGAADGLKGCTQLDGRALATALSAGLEKVKQRGGAKAGDKTMIDALEPAVAVALQLQENPLDQVIAGIAAASREGMEKTKNMIATTGKAKTLGDRSLGFADPGAVSMSLIFQFASEYIADLGQGKA
jgi:dihydroxyacetone kinase-like protein